MKMQKEMQIAIKLKMRNKLLLLKKLNLMITKSKGPKINPPNPKLNSELQMISQMKTMKITVKMNHKKKLPKRSGVLEKIPT